MLWKQKSPFYLGVMKRSSSWAEHCQTCGLFGNGASKRLLKPPLFDKCHKNTPLLHQTSWKGWGRLKNTLWEMKLLPVILDFLSGSNRVFDLKRYRKLKVRSNFCFAHQVKDITSQMNTNYFPQQNLWFSWVASALDLHNNKRGKSYLKIQHPTILILIWQLFKWMMKIVANRLETNWRKISGTF